MNGGSSHPGEAGRVQSRGWSRRFGSKWLGVLPLLISLLALILLTRASATSVFHIPYVAGPYFNIVLLGGASFFVAYLAWRGFAVSGQVQILLFGGGALSLGMATVLGAVVFLLFGQVNVTAAIHTTGTLLSSILFVTGAAVGLGGGALFKSQIHGKWLALGINAAVLLLPFFFWALNATGVIPTFFIIGQGDTLLRTVMLDAAISLFTLSGLAYLWLNRKTASSFMHWYGLGLLLFTLGLYAWQFAKVNDDSFLWLGRVTQYLGGVYFVIAAVSAVREARTKHVPVAEVVAAFFRQTKENYELLVNSASDAIIAVDGLGRILMWNPAAEKMFGYSRSEAIGSAFFDLIFSPEHAGSYKKAADTVGPERDNDGSSVTMELRARRRNGEEFPVELTLTSKKLAAGWLTTNTITTTTTTLILKDITERKRAEEELRESEQKFSLLFDKAAFIAVLSRLPNGVIVDVNEAFVKLFGYTKEEAVGKTTQEMGMNPDPEVRARIVAELQERGSVRDQELTLHTKSGELRILSINVDLVDIGGQKYILNTAQDITEPKRAEEALRESEERFRVALKGSPINVSNQDLDLRYTWIYNPELGYSPGDVVGKTDADLLPAEVAGRLAPIKRRVLEIGVEEKTEVSIAHADETLFFDFTISPLRDAEGKITGITNVVINITERKRAENALRESEQRWATTLASIGDAVISTDVEGRITFMNAEAEALTGWTLAEALTRPVTEVFNIINEHTRREADDPVTRVLQEGMIVGLANHTILVKKDGKEVPIDDSGAPIRDGDGKTMGVVLVFRDITERKKADGQLAYQANLLANVNDAIIATDLERRITSWNSAAERMFGWKREQVLGKPASEIVRSEFTEEQRAESLRVMRQGIAYTLQLLVYHKDGHPIWNESTNVVVRDSAGAVTGYISVNRDITERKRAEEALRKAHNELEIRVQERTAELEEANVELEAKIEEQRWAEEQIRKQAELLDKAQDAIGLQDLEHRLIYWNKSAERLYGWKQTKSQAKMLMSFCIKKNHPTLLKLRRESSRKVSGKESWGR